MTEILLKEHKNRLATHPSITFYNAEIPDILHTHKSYFKGIIGSQLAET